MRRLLSLKAQRLAQLLPMLGGPAIENLHLTNACQQSQEHQSQHALHRMPHATRPPRILHLRKYSNQRLHRKHRRRPPCPLPEITTQTPRTKLLRHRRRQSSPKRLCSPPVLAASFLASEIKKLYRHECTPRQWPSHRADFRMPKCMRLFAASFSSSMLSHRDAWVVKTTTVRCEVD